MIHVHPINRLRQRFRFLINSTACSRSQHINSCAICSMDPVVIPYQTCCGHIYCYTCLRHAIFEAAGSKNYKCEICGTKVTSSQPYSRSTL